MTLCPKCTVITPTLHTYAHHPSIEALRTSAHSCPLCHIILTTLENSNQISLAENYREHANNAYSIVNDTSITLSTNTHFPSRSSSTKPWRLVVTCGRIKREHGLNEGKFYNAAAETIGIFAREGDAAAETVVTRPVQGSTGGPEVLDIVRGWIAECKKGHEKCQLGYVRGEVARAGEADLEASRLRGIYRDEDVALPTRVLDVEAEGGGVRLREAVEIGGRGCYAALSHCWGQSQHVKTVQREYSQRKASIAFDELPKTFQDAVVVTRKLGVRYLWIDSLCIIQDSASDWERESLRMGSVYHNAFFTIAASSSIDGDGGLFYDRPVPDPTTEVSLPFTNIDGSPSGTWTIHSHPPNYSAAVLRGPLNSRAWTLQEKHLSRRIIHFTHDEVYFECKRAVSFESRRPSHVHGVDALSLSILYWTAVQLHKNLMANAMLVTSAILARQWSSIVEDYTKRALTYGKDKLPALWGMVALLSDLTGDVCHSGLWRGMLHSQLLWRTANYAEQGERRGRVLGRAPSWSWASVDGAVYMPLGTRELESWHLDAVVEELQVVPGTDERSVDENGVLELKGWVATARLGDIGVEGQWDYDCFVKHIEHCKLFGFSNAMSSYETVRTRNHNFFGWAAMDERPAAADVAGKYRHWYYPLSEDESPKLECLFVNRRRLKETDSEAAKKDPFVQSYLVLFLQRLEGEDVYGRVGMGQMLQCEESDMGEKRLIRIV